MLVVHNAYQQRGGEDAVVEAEVELLRSHGHEVVLYQRSNDDIEQMPRAAVAVQTLWSTRTTREITRLIATFGPAVVHVHNTLPLISPSVYWAASRARVPVVQTLHNFRLLCPQALMLRDNRVCEDCVGHVPWRAVRHACYRGSATQSAVVATLLQGHRVLGTWQNRITRYIALNDFCRDKFIAGGLPIDRLRVKPNFVDVALTQDATTARRGFLFVGRLSVEKGIGTLADAMRHLSVHCKLRVIGGGPEQALLADVENIELQGPRSPAEVLGGMRSAQALVVPSIWYENFPRTIVEGFACGLPIIASRIGALESLVREGVTGLLFEPGNATDLASKLSWAQQNPDEMVTMGKNARAYYEEHLTGAANYPQLLAIYDDAIHAVRTDGKLARSES